MRCKTIAFNVLFFTQDAKFRQIFKTKITVEAGGMEYIRLYNDLLDMYNCYIATRIINYLCS